MRDNNDKDIPVYNFIVQNSPTREDVKSEFGTSRMASIRRLIERGWVRESWERFYTGYDDFVHFRYRYYRVAR
jgi:hypothetical protein